MPGEPKHSTTERRLAAIMFTDIVGYTSLMQHDEAKALKTIERHRSAIEKYTHKYHGEILNYYGDGSLSLFPSAFEAVEAALEIQKKLTRDPPTPLRIGIHLGDVKQQGEAVFGDGINLASRIQSLSVAGSIFITDAIYRIIKNQSDIRTVPLGNFRLKNIEDPVPVYALATDYLTVPHSGDLPGRTRSLRVKAKWGIAFAILLTLLAAFLAIRILYPGEKRLPGHTAKSIAVLPFKNLSNDPEQEYFSDGMMEEILDRLFKIGDLKVISRTSSMRYKNSDLSLKEIAGELGVSAILEGSVRRIGNNVRITVQLIDAKTDAHLWSEIYDGDLSDLSRIFFIQSEVAQSVARELKAVLSPQEVKLIENISTTDLIAYENYLKGKFAIQKYNAEDLSLAMQYFEKALERDPDFALAYTGIASVWLFRQQGGMATPDEAVPKTMEAVEKALELDNSLAEVHFMQANLNVLGLWDWEAAESAYKKAIEINPNHAEAHGLYAQLLFITGKREEAMKHNELSIKLDPVNPVVKMWHTYVLLIDGRYDDCIALSREVLEKNPTAGGFHHLLSMAFHMKGKYDEAFEATKLLFSDAFRNFDRVFDQYEKLGYAGTMNLLADTFFARSKTEWISPATIAMLYCYAGNKERALDCLELAYEMRDVHVIYSGSHPFFAIIHDEPRYHEIMRKLNLPVNRINPS